MSDSWSQKTALKQYLSEKNILSLQNIAEMFSKVKLINRRLTSMFERLMRKISVSITPTLLPTLMVPVSPTKHQNLVMWISNSQNKREFISPRRLMKQGSIQRKSQIISDNSTSIVLIQSQRDSKLRELSSKKKVSRTASHTVLVVILHSSRKRRNHGLSTSRESNQN